MKSVFFVSLVANHQGTTFPPIISLANLGFTTFPISILPHATVGQPVTVMQQQAAAEAIQIQNVQRINAALHQHQQQQQQMQQQQQQQQQQHLQQQQQQQLQHNIVKSEHLDNS
jgi:hypothetical protein